MGVGGAGGNLVLETRWIARLGPNRRQVCTSRPHCRTYLPWTEPGGAECTW